MVEPFRLHTTFVCLHGVFWVFGGFVCLGGGGGVLIKNKS